jgi:F-type H+-transporting ATPase subunit b
VSAKLKTWLIASLLPLTVMIAHAHAHAAIGEKAAEEEAGAEAEEPGHHGHLTFRDVVAGHESLQFWGSVVNFALLVYLIRRYAKAPLAKFLNDRREAIDRGIREAAEVKRSAEQAFQTYNERMKSLDDELAKLRKEVAAAAERDRARISEEANTTVARLKAETEALVQRQTEQLEAQIRREVVSAAADAAERAVRESSTPEDQQRLADAFLRELGKVADGGGGVRRPA